MTNPEQLEEWRRQARDPDPSVRWNLTSHENLPEEIFAILAADDDFMVASGVAHNYTAPTWVLDELSTRESLHEIAARKPNARPELEDQAPSVRSVETRSTATSNNATPRSLIDANSLACTSKASIPAARSLGRSGLRFMGNPSPRTTDTGTPPNGVNHRAHLRRVSKSNRFTRHGACRRFGELARGSPRISQSTICLENSSHLQLCLIEAQTYC